MIKDIDITQKIIDNNKREKALNRFHISSLWGIVNGYTSVEEYVNGKNFSAIEIWDMNMGSAKHSIIQELIKNEYDLEVKEEIKEDDIEIVGKADCVAKDKSHLLEIKTSKKLYDKAKSWHIYQVKFYLSLLNIPLGYIVQPVEKEGRLYLKVLEEVKRPTKKWLENQINLLLNFYKEVQNYAKPKL